MVIPLVPEKDAVIPASGADNFVLVSRGVSRLTRGEHSMNQPGNSEVRDQVNITHEDDGLQSTKQSPEETEQFRAAGARKSTTNDDVTEYFPADVEDVSMERVEAGTGDSGQIETLPDGSISVPVLEEELVISKRLVVRERIIIRKNTQTEHHRVEANLRRERVEVEVEDPHEERSCYTKCE
jgi:uncharacterized protein (TIGR02271 family)